MPAVILAAPGAVFQDPNKQAVHSNATVTSSSSSILDGYGATEVTLFINVKASPTGSSPTLQYTIQEVDPGDGSTVIGATATSTSITGIGIQKISLPSTFGGSIKVSWTVGGSSPSFTQVYATLVGKQSSVKIVDNSGAAVTASNPTSVYTANSTTTGNLTTGGSTVSIAAGTGNGIGVDISGTWVGTVTFEATVDGTTWTAVNAVPLGGGAETTTTTANGTWILPGGAITQFRTRMSSYTSGTAAVSIASTPGLRNTRVFNTSAANLFATVTQGTAAALSGGWPVKVTDGTNTMPTGDVVGRALFQKITDGTNTASVKPASTAAVATDPALVVAISPNNSLTTTPTADSSPATQNVTTQDTNSSTAVGANNQTIITGTPTANSAASFSLSSWETAQIQVTGTWTGTLQVELSPDGGTTWYVRRIHQIGTDITSNSFTANFSGGANVGGYTNLRVRATAAMTGTATVRINQSLNPNAVYIGNAQRITDNAGNYMPVGDVASRAMFVKQTDGTNTMPTADVAARKLFAAITDGTNTMPTMDAIGRRGFVGITDGTNSMPMMDAAARRGFITVTDGTNSMPTGDAVGRAIFQKITDGTNTAAVKAASTLAAVTDPALVVALSPNNTPFQFGGDDRLKVGFETITFFDTFEGASINTINWTQSQSGMTQTVANTGLLLNAGSSLTSGNYSIATSTKSVRTTDEFGLYFQYRCRIITRPNAVIEFGRGNVATTAAPTDGVFFRVPSGGQLQGVINFNGTETVTQLAAAGAFTSTDYYGFEIEIFEDEVVFEVYATGATVPTWTATVGIPTTQPAPTASANLPNFARVYNSSTVTTPAAQLYVGNVVVTVMDGGPAFPDASSVTSVASSATNVTLLAANPNRKGGKIVNESNQILFVKFGVTASATSYTYRVTANSTVELPMEANGLPWTGQIDGIWASANGNARITEIF